MAPPPTIDLTSALARIDDLLCATSKSRVLRLSGDVKGGKSHILAKVVPALAHQRNIPHAVVDFKETSIVDVLHTLFDQLGGSEAFPAYGRARANWLMPRPAAVKLTGLTLLLSYIRVSVSHPDPHVHAQDMLNALRVPFCDDINCRRDPLIVFIFDSFDDISQPFTLWFNSFVPSLLSTFNTRILIGARRFTIRAPTIWNKHCSDFTLCPIMEAEPYMAYCRSLRINLSEDLVERVLQSLSYKPGSFVEWVQPALSRESPT